MKTGGNSGWDGLCHVKGGRSEVDDEKQVATGARPYGWTDLGRGHICFMVWFTHRLSLVIDNEESSIKFDRITVHPIRTHGQNGLPTGRRRLL
jgi:hypothetical protein